MMEIDMITSSLKEHYKVSYLGDFYKVLRYRESPVLKGVRGGSYPTSQFIEIKFGKGAWKFLKGICTLPGHRAIVYLEDKEVYHLWEIR